MPWTRIAALTLASTLVLTFSCRWREGREVWIERFDAGDIDGDATDCGELSNPCWLPAYNLMLLLDSADEELVIVDIRDEELCRANRVPGARCVPWGAEGFAGDIECSSRGGWLVLYDGNGEDLTTAVGGLPEECERSVHLVVDGFAGWSACAECPIERDETEGADAG